MASRNIVVALDESEQSLQALKWALSFVIRPESDTVILVNVDNPYSLYHGNPAFDIPEDAEVEEGATEEAPAAIFDAAQALCRERKVPCTIKSYSGEPRELLCLACEEHLASLLVIGSRGGGPVKRPSFLGSVSDYCSKYARCPVVVARPKTQSMSALSPRSQGRISAFA